MPSAIFFWILISSSLSLTFGVSSLAWDSFFTTLSVLYPRTVKAISFGDCLNYSIMATVFLFLWKLYKSFLPSTLLKSVWNSNSSFYRDEILFKSFLNFGFIESFLKNSISTCSYESNLGTICLDDFFYFCYLKLPLSWLIDDFFFTGGLLFFTYFIDKSDLNERTYFELFFVIIGDLKIL